MNLKTTETNNNGFAIQAYLAFLDSVVEECGPCACLVPASNARTRRAKLSYHSEKAEFERQLKKLDSSALVVPYKVYAAEWEVRLCKRRRYDTLREDYTVSVEKNDLRYPQDARLVPGYAKDALGQLRTLQAISFAFLKQQGKLA